MKTLKITKPLNLVLILIQFTTILFYGSCDELDKLTETNLFGTDYNTNLPAGVDPVTVQQLVANSDIQITSASKTFAPDNATGGGTSQSRVRLFGDPSTSQSSILITMARLPQSDLEYARSMNIEVVGPFTENVPITQGLGEINFGNPLEQTITLTTDNRNDVYFRFTITKLDLNNDRIQGNFEFLTKNDNATFSCAVFNGAFNWRLEH